MSKRLDRNNINIQPKIETKITKSKLDEDFLKNLSSQRDRYMDDPESFIKERENETNEEIIERFENELKEKQEDKETENNDDLKEEDEENIFNNNIDEIIEDIDETSEEEEEEAIKEIKDDEYNLKNNINSYPKRDTLKEESSIIASSKKEINKIDDPELGGLVNEVIKMTKDDRERADELYEMLYQRNEEGDWSRQTTEGLTRIVSAKAEMAKNLINIVDIKSKILQKTISASAQKKGGDKIMNIINMEALKKMAEESND